jgi:phosphatidylserine/phosphatidylglycerophosphate/cardiolipin synthase-like enzyme
MTLPAGVGSRELDVAPSQPPATSPAGDVAVSVEWLVDNAEAYSRLLAALRTARHSVRIAQLALDADCVAYPNPQSVAPESCAASGDVLAETLLAAGGRGVDVSVLLNSTLLLDTTRALRRFLDASGTRVVQLRGTRRFPQLLHAKIVVIDGVEAFLLGSPFVNGYWDDRMHRPVDQRRPMRELSGRPLHDLSVRITGPVAGGLDRLFCDLWNEASVIVGDRNRDLTPHRSSDADQGQRRRLRLVRTLPRGGVSGMPDGATEILDACLDGIGRARSLIYIEHQYLSARPVVAALADALRRAPTLEIIAVLNQNPDITAYRAWQNARLAEWKLLDHPRVGLFALWTAERRAGDAGRLAVNQVFVHSKVLAVDDRWATTGSANLDGVSLHSYGDDFTGWLGRRLFHGIRNLDVNVVIDDDMDDATGAGTVEDLRMRLWSEHLGLSRASLAVPPRGGWLNVWRASAAENVAALNATSADGGAPRRMQGFVLPYSPEATPIRQLADIGVQVHSAQIDLCFDPGWLEVHFSPNWVRNMFS